MEVTQNITKIWEEETNSKRRTWRWKRTLIKSIIEIDICKATRKIAAKLKIDHLAIGRFLRHFRKVKKLDKNIYFVTYNFEVYSIIFGLTTRNFLNKQCLWPVLMKDKSYNSLTR